MQKLHRGEENMEETTQKLYKELRNISAFFLIYQLRDNIERTKKIIPEIQKFVFWFLEGNKFGIDEELYQGMSRNLLCILEDILEAMKHKDMVLLHDAITYGLIEYLELFVDVEHEEKEDDYL